MKQKTKVKTIPDDRDKPNYLVIVIVAIVFTLFTFGGLVLWI